MAAEVRSDRRIARACATACASTRRASANATAECCPYTSFQSGRVDLHLESAREGHIRVALTGRGRWQQHRRRGMSTRIRALVPEAVDASTVTPCG
jgi:hypothetical protein